ncbi:MAG TPA: hypothetical protein VHV10_10530 [Ktedonobacteraceae bacterium]|nr:hypothetical protein [Ktedonobacteraceae bacterium]
MQTFTTQKQSISPTVMMVIHESSKPIVTLSFPDGGRINVIKVNHFTHRCELRKQLALPACTAYLVNALIDENKNAYYLVLFNEAKQCHSCSCYGYRLSGQCSHADSVDQHVESERMAQVVVEALPPVKDEIDVTTKRTVEDWREIMKRDKERQRKEWGQYWHEAKLLQLQAQAQQSI